MRIETQIVQRVTRAMHCSKCGVEAAAACDCGVPYVPAGVAAAKAVAAHPEKSDRSLAKEAGVSHPTMAKARREAEAGGKVLPPETRTGTDGKSYPATKPKREPEPEVDESNPDKAYVLDLVEEVLDGEPLTAKQTATFEKIKKRLKRRARDDAKREARNQQSINFMIEGYKAALPPFIAKLVAADLAHDLWLYLTMRGPCGYREGWAFWLVPSLVDALEEVLGPMACEKIPASDAPPPDVGAENMKAQIATADDGSPARERDRETCVALYQKVIEAEAELKAAKALHTAEGDPPTPPPKPAKALGPDDVPRGFPDTGPVTTADDGIPDILRRDRVQP